MIWQARVNPNKSVWSYLEAIVLTAIALGVSFKLNSADPFFFHAAFPWIWFIPVLLALRYGMGPGLLSVCMITLVFVFNQSADALEQNYHRLYLLSGCILTLICAEFSSLWAARVRRAEQAAFYAEHRLNQMAHAYHVISHSHTQLEQSLIAKPVTLRSAVQACIDLLKESNGALSNEHAKRFIELISFNCNIEECALYLMEQNKLALQPAAKIGDMNTLAVEDPLVLRCLQEGLTSYHAVNELSRQDRSEYLVCAPMQDSQGKVLGLFVIKSMPFLALNDENLQLLSILLGYYANQHGAYLQAQAILKHYPNCPLEFAAQLMQLTTLSRNAGVVSTLTGIYIKSWDKQADFIQALLAQRRGLDLIWVYQADDICIVFVLMPFTAEAALLGYRNRIERWLQESYGVDLMLGPVTIHAQALKHKNPIDHLNQLIEYRNHHEPVA